MSVPSEFAGPPPTDVAISDFLRKALEVLGFPEVHFSAVRQNGISDLVVADLSGGISGPAEFHAK